MGVIRFPTERRLQAAARAGNEAAAAAQTAPAAEPLAAGQAFAFMSMEIRRLPTTTSRIDGEIAARILNRCVLAALEILSKEKIPVDLAGTVLRPVIEATFPGPFGAACPLPSPNARSASPVTFCSIVANSIGMMNLVDAEAPICFSASRY